MEERHTLHDVIVGSVVISRRHRTLRRAVYTLFFFSGASALVYQVLWVRQLGLVFGVTSYAVATVLTAFMGGLALGSWFFGRLALRIRRVLWTFGALEAGVGLSALVLPYAFAALRLRYAVLYESFAGHPAAFAAVRFTLLALLLAVPCSLMGGTLAVLSKLLSRGPTSYGRDIGLLYGLNTLGAVVGALLAGFYLIAHFGVQTTTWIAASVSLGCAATAALLQGWTPPVTADDGAGPGGDAGPEAAGEPKLARLTLVVLAVSGFCALGYEVLWSRTLVFYLHNSTYAFTAMLACFLLGIGLGSLVPAGAVDRARRPALLLALSQLAIGGLTLVSLRHFASLTWVLKLFAQLTLIDSWWKALGVQGTQAALILLPSTFFMGLTFPVGVRLYTRALTTVSREVGTLYSANTIGAITGSLAVGFLLLPALGLVTTFKLLISANLLAGLAVLLQTAGAASRVGRAALAGMVVLPLLVAFGIPADLFYKTFEKNAVILFYRDGVSDTVMVKAPSRNSPVRGLYFSDGRGAAGTQTNPSNRVSGHLPLLLHGSAQRVLTIAFGVGNTLAAIVSHPEVEQIDVAELSPNVLAAAPYFPTNDRAWEDPRVRMHIQDGRNYLLGVKDTYDVIQLEPPEIHTDGVVYLYTRELYELARRRLNPGGLICQWANVRMMPLREQKSMIRTFLEVFPHGTVWMPRQVESYVLLIGGDDELLIDYSAFRRRFEVEPVRRDILRATGIRTPAELLASFKLSPEGARTFSEGVPLITDDRTWVDFSTPRSTDANYGLSNAFSGMLVPTLHPGGVQATRDYHIAKIRAIAAASESVLPLLHNFASEEERAAVEAELEAASMRLAQHFEERIEGLQKDRILFVNM